jgi:hypothetical protein
VVDKDTIVQALGEFYSQYIVTTANGSFQIFRSFTYGEMVIALLLATILVMFTLKWIWEAMR